MIIPINSSIGTEYFTPDITDEDTFFNLNTFGGDDYDCEMIKRCMAFIKKDDAIRFAKKMIAFNQSIIIGNGYDS
jgi:hypothetical protein